MAAIPLTIPVKATPNANTSVNLATAQATIPGYVSQYNPAQTPGAYYADPSSMGNANTWNANTATQDPTKGTVAGQLTSLIDVNSPLMQRAAAKANEASNNRGMLNSTMAVGAAQGAVLDSAMPIAQADANSNNQFAMNNAGFLNQAAQSNASAENSAKQFNASNQQQVNLTNADASNKIGILNTEAQNTAQQFNAQQANAVNTSSAQMQTDVAKLNAQQQNAITMNQLDQANKIQLADIQATYQNQIQANASSSALYDKTMASIAAVQADPNMSAEAKQNTINMLSSLLRSGLNMTGSIANLNLGGLINFNG